MIWCSIPHFNTVPNHGPNRSELLGVIHARQAMPLGGHDLELFTGVSSTRRCGRAFGCTKGDVRADLALPFAVLLAARETGTGTSLVDGCDGEAARAVEVSFGRTWLEQDDLEG